jgi:hypothetical protein
MNLKAALGNMCGSQNIDRHGLRVDLIRRGILLVKKREGKRLPTLPAARKSASLRSVWNELDCHVAALLAMTRRGRLSQ